MEEGMKNRIIILLVVIINAIAIILNFKGFLMGNSATQSNLIVSIVYLMIWIIVSVYAYIQKDILLTKFMLIYWAISMSISILSINVSISLLVPLYIIYFAPFYGFTTFFKTYIPTFSFIMSAISALFVIITAYFHKRFK